MRWSAQLPICCVKGASTRFGTAPSPPAPACRWRRPPTTSPPWTSAESTADVLVDLLVGDGPGTRDAEQLISRYERYIACARQPGLRDVQRQIMKQRTDAVVEVVERSGRCVRSELLTALVCAVDGAVVASLVGVGEGPRATARATLVDVIDVLAPFD
jgi:DNA-binding transcriptional regulator YbjK